MRIGTVTEIKNHEYRVGLDPGIGRANSSRMVIEVWVQGRCRARHRCNRRRLWKPAGAVIQARCGDGCSRAPKWLVKGQGTVGGRTRANCARVQVLYTYLHLAPDPETDRRSRQVGA